MARRTWEDAGFTGDLDGDRYASRARSDYDIRDFDEFDVHSAGMPGYGGSMRNARNEMSVGTMHGSTTDDTHLSTMHDRSAGMLDSTECLDEMKRYVEQTTGMQANVSHIMPPLIKWETVMATPFKLTMRFSLLSKEIEAIFRQPKWYPLYMEVEGVLRPILLDSTLEPLYNKSVGQSLSNRGLKHAESKNFLINDQVYVSNTFLMDDRFFVSIIVLEQSGQKYVGHIKAYFYLHTDRNNDNKKKTPT